MNKSVGVLGCGWLGFPLAKSLKKDGYQVLGTTTSIEKIPQLEKEGITPFLISLTEEGPIGPISRFLENSRVLVLNVPPGLRGNNRANYVKKIQGLYEAIPSTPSRKVVFISSTSVYGSAKGEVNEDTVPEPSTESGKQLLEAENIFRNDKNIQTTIVRFGGLIGKDRHPIVQLSGKEELKNGGAPINLIHLDDGVAIIKSILAQGWWGEIFNAVYPAHPPKAVYYHGIAKKRGVPTPQYRDSDGKNHKKVMSSKLILVKNYHFITPI